MSSFRESFIELNFILTSFMTKNVLARAGTIVPLAAPLEDFNFPYVAP